MDDDDEYDDDDQGPAGSYLSKNIDPTLWWKGVGPLPQSLRRRASMKAIDHNITLHADDIAEVEHAAFVGRFSNSSLRLVFIQDEFIVETTSLIGLGEILADKYPQVSLVGTTNSHMILTTRDQCDNPAFISLYIKGDTRSSEISKSTLTAYVVGTPAIAREVIKFLDDNYPMSRRSTVDWHYIGAHGATHTSMTMDEAQPICQEYYPWIKDPHLFFRRYLDSTASLMFLAGPAGTGKTSFLRRLIWENKLHVMVAYDKKLLDSDELLMTFLGGRSNLLVLEDSEEFLRRRDLGNHMVSRFLNASDGLIRPKDKKIIFTTNYKEFNDIDSALTRPGRSFAFVEFRELTYREAIAAARVGNLPIPLAEKDYTLAELFNQGTKVREEPSIGFKHGA